MTRLDRTLGWLPAFFVGASAAVAAEVAVGILLYADSGLMRSLSTVLVTAVGAFAMGLWAAPAFDAKLTDVIRRRWVMCLIAFLGAAIFGTSWTVVRDMGTGSLGQGIGLAVLAAFPLYACGAVLGGLSVANTHDPRGPLSGPGAPAALGAAVGFGIAGAMLPRAPMPSSLLIASLVVLSLGGLIYGVVLGARPRAFVRAERATVGGDVRVEDRNANFEGGAARVLLQGDQLRRWLRLDASGVESWDVAVARAAMPPSDQAWRVLSVGGGASSLALTVVREHPLAYIDVLERLSEVVDLGREHFDTDLSVGDSDRRSVRVGNLDDLIDALVDEYDLVVVDGQALALLGGSAGISLRSRETLAAHVAEQGVLAWGPNVNGTREPSSVWDHCTLVRESDEGLPERVLIASRHELRALEDGFSGFANAAGVPSES